MRKSGLRSVDWLKRIYSRAQPAAPFPSPFARVQPVSASRRVETPLTAKNRSHSATRDNTEPVFDSPGLSRVRLREDTEVCVRKYHPSVNNRTKNRPPV